MCKLYKPKKYTKPLLYLLRSFYLILGMVSRFKTVIRAISQFFSILYKKNKDNVEKCCDRIFREIIKYRMSVLDYKTINHNIF